MSDWMDLTKAAGRLKVEKMRNSFTCFRSFIEGLEPLDAESFKRLMLAIAHYAMDDELPVLEGLEASLFLAWKANVDASNRRRDNGRKGGRPKNEPEVKETKQEAKETEKNRKKPKETEPKGNKKENKKEKENKNVKEKSRKEKSFAPPTLEEVRAYCTERGNKVDPEKFFAYYQAGHWVDQRGQPVKNWKQKLITWEKKDERPPARQQAYDFAEIERTLVG